MNNELKYEMQRYFNVDPDMDYLPFDSYLEMAARKKDVDFFETQFFKKLCQHADKAEELLIQQLEINSRLSNPEPQRIKTVIDVTNAAAQMLEIKKVYSVPDGLVIEVVNSPLNREPLPMQQPVVMVSAKRQQLNTATELLEACSEDLFISGDDAELEARVDKFLKEVKSC